jgi:hypothetical protein
MEAMVANRAQLLSEQEQLAGEVMLSIGNQEEFKEDFFYDYSREHLSDWQKMVRPSVEGSRRCSCASAGWALTSEMSFSH